MQESSTMGSVNIQLYSFSKALEMMIDGAKMTRLQFGNSIYCRVQKPDENSMNTLPYIQMIKRSDDVNGGFRVARFPVTLSVESIFANDWHVVAPTYK